MSTTAQEREICVNNFIINLLTIFSYVPSYFECCWNVLKIHVHLFFMYYRFALCNVGTLHAFKIWLLSYCFLFISCF